jgi:ADP-ribose pyrophosphatase YjhB (NUDIX family)
MAYLCYNWNVHKDFYASGFLYHPRTQQILLQQDKVNNDNKWSLFGGDFTHEEDIKDAVIRIISSHLNFQLKPKSVFSIYDYVNKGKTTYIFYAHITKLEKFSHESKLFSWFTFKQIRKLGLSEQAKQDIIIGQRVIDSSIRKGLGLQTIG